MNNKGLMNNHMQGEIWVIGDSHARIFSYNENFMPFYVGNGRKHCFINDECLSNVISRVLTVAKENIANHPMILVLGEPDTRFYLGRGWKPWKNKYKNGWKFLKRKYGFFLRRRSGIRKSFKRYCHLINNVKNKSNARLLILNILPSNRKDQNKLVNYFNKLLSKFCAQEKDVEFIYINKDIYNSETKTIKEEYYGDSVHLNMMLQFLIEDWLIKNAILEKSLYDKENNMDIEKIKSRYRFNERFGCYTM